MRSTARFRWIAWSLLVLVGGLAVAAISLSRALQSHADGRREILTAIGRLETLGTAQSGLVWRALTTKLVDERLAFVRLRGEEQRRRGEVMSCLQDLEELASQDADWTVWLGFSAESKELADVGTTTSRFLAGVQGTFGQMSLSSQRIRQRLRYWDMDFGQFAEALAALRRRETAIAAASSSTAATATQFAAGITLLAAVLFALWLSSVKGRRGRELQEERLHAVAAREARFRELVQNGSDLILVVDAAGLITYASPSAAALVGEEVVEAAVSASPTLPVHRILGRDADALLAAGRSEFAVEAADGSTATFDVQARDLRDHAEIAGIVLNARDVTERKALEDQLRHQALHDPLTNLPNRRRFQAEFEALDDAQRASAAVLFLDLDGFKLVNDSYGHRAGDDLLREVSCRVGSCLGPADVLARQGGDEFLILHHGDAGRLAQGIAAALQPPFGVEGREIFISASLGIVTNLAGLDAEQAAQRADIAMYEAKRLGKARAVNFAEQMLDGAPERLALERDFRRALERDEFTVVYQPKVGLHSGRTESLEALVRWHHPERGFVGPDLFIPFAEESGLIGPLGQLVLERACHDAVRWQDAGVVVAVNLSPIQFRDPLLVDGVRHAIETSGIHPKFLELEITESAVLGDVTNTIAVMKELKALGCRLAIDDFGTGYSNLAHLKHFDVDVLKIDQAFVRGGNPGTMDRLSDGAIVQAVIGMAKAFGMHVVAEGVESQIHADSLKHLGADLGQGYFFSKPVSADAIDALLHDEAASGVAATHPQ